MKLARLLLAVILALSLMLVMLLSLPYVPKSLAQSGDIIMTKTLDRPTNVVRVGEVLTFTVALTNNSTFTLTNVTLIDDYDQNILAFAGSIPPQDVHNPGTGTITWTNVATPATIPPGQSITVTVVFTVEHPQPATVNQVRAQDIIHESGNLTVTAEASRTQEAIGGAAPVFKSTSPPGATPQAGLPVTFSHIITNDGAALMTFLPLTDTYDPNFLQFNYAIPTPSLTSPGQLVWTDLTTYFGNIAPFDSVVVTTVFTAMTQVVSTTNQVSTEGAIDEYNNNLTAGLAQVPIVIVDNSSGSGSGGSSGSEDSDDEDQAPAPTQANTATPAPTATSTPVVINTATPTQISSQNAITGPNAPRFLPETGYRAPGGNFVGLIIVLSLLALLGYLFGIKESEDS